MKSMIGNRLDRYVVTRMPSGVCGWCRHSRALHRGGRPCEVDDCRCLRADPVPVLISAGHRPTCDELEDLFR